MTKLFKVDEIEWDMDCENIDLPTKIDGFEVEGDEDCDWNETIADKLSDVYGWCVNSFTSEEIVQPVTKEDVALAASYLHSVLRDVFSCSNPNGTDNFCFEDNEGRNWCIKVSPCS
jgi:hypothetical protein